MSRVYHSTAIMFHGIIRQVWLRLTILAPRIAAMRRLCKGAVPAGFEPKPTPRMPFSRTRRGLSHLLLLCDVFLGIILKVLAQSAERRLKVTWVSNTVPLHITHVVSPTKDTLEKSLDLIHDRHEGGRGGPCDLSAFELSALQHGLSIRIDAQDDARLASVHGDELQPRILIEATIALVAIFINLDLDVETRQDEAQVRPFERAPALYGTVPLPMVGGSLQLRHAAHDLGEDVVLLADSSAYHVGPQGCDAVEAVAFGTDTRSPRTSLCQIVECTGFGLTSHVPGANVSLQIT
jgi:hypothetical protein